MGRDLDKQRICIVVCANKPELADMTIESLGKLNIPEGFKVDVCTIEAEENIAKAYNEAIRSSNAQYKLYLREGVAIENADILIELVNLFAFDYRVGIVGLSGAEYVPVNCNINSTRKKYGKVYNKKEHEAINWNDFDTKAKCVAALDNWFLATQYDIEWREDLFASADYLGLAQCQEFKRNGYDALVMKQAKPWVSIDDFFRVAELYDEAGKETYKSEYYKEVFPLVSVLIPTHNRPEYFKIALESAINQTYKNLEIIVSDDSDNYLTKNVMSEYLGGDERVRYFYHKGMNSRNNWFLLLDTMSGEYINWLMDDDIFELDKIESMIDYYRENDNVSLVTSAKKIIDEKGTIINNLHNSIMVNAPTLFKGGEVGKDIISRCFNIVGEPTTVLIKKELLEISTKNEYTSKEIEYNGIFFRKIMGWDIGTKRLYGMGDMMLWLNLLSKGNLVYIPEALSSFRVHSKQSQVSNVQNFDMLTLIGMYLLLHHVWYKKLFDIKYDEFFEILNFYYEKINQILPKINEDTTNSQTFSKCAELAEYELKNKKIINIFNSYEF